MTSSLITNIQTNCPFPSPPDFAENYTTENIKAYFEGRGGPALPPPPIPNKFTVFNEEFDLEGVINIIIIFTH